MPRNTPPIMVESLLKLAWGLTLNLSADEPQRKIGEMANEKLGKLLESPGLIDKDKLYLNEVLAYLSSFLRNMGYEKDFLVQELDINEEIRKEEIKSINDLADLTSLSNEGIIARIVAFLFGGASVFPLIERLYPAGANKASEVSSKIVENSSQIVTKIGEMTVTNSTSSKFTPGVPPEFAVPNEILIFLIGGGIGIFALTIIIKLGKSWWIKNRILKKTIQDQQSHWEKHVRDEFKWLMRDLFYSIKFITKRYYPNYDNEPIMTYDDAALIKFIDLLLPIKDLYAHTNP